MAKIKKDKPPTKAEIILAYLSAHPKATNEKIVADLKAKGIHTNKNFVAQVRTGLATGKLTRTRPSRKKESQPCDSHRPRRERYFGLLTDCLQLCCFISEEEVYDLIDNASEKELQALEDLDFTDVFGQMADDPTYRPWKRRRIKKGGSRSTPPTADEA